MKVTLYPVTVSVFPLVEALIPVLIPFVLSIQYIS